MSLIPRKDRDHLRTESIRACESDNIWNSKKNKYAMPRPVYSQPSKDIAQFTRDELPISLSSGQAPTSSPLRHPKHPSCHSGAAFEGSWLRPKESAKALALP